MTSSFYGGVAQHMNSRNIWYAWPIWLAYAALAPVAVYSFVNLVVVLLVAALGVHGWRGLSRSLSGVRSFAGTEMLVLAGIWSALICTWSIAPEDAWGTLLRLGVLAIAACAALSGIFDLSAQHLRTLQSIIIASGFILLGIYAFELAFGAPIAGALKDVYMGDVKPGASQDFIDRLYIEKSHAKIARGTVALGALAIPVAFLLWRRAKDMRLVGLWLATCFVVSLFTHMSSVPVALFGALIAAGVIWFFPKRGLTILAAGAALFAVLLPLPLQQIDQAERIGVESEGLGVSTQHRIQIYNYTATLIGDRPLTGWGFRAARQLSDQAPSFIAAGYDAPFNDGQTLLPVHPHNMSLQLWLETGFVGIALFCGALLLGAWRADHSSLKVSHRMLIGATGTFLFAIANLSFGIWQFHWLALIALSAGAVLVCCHRPRHKMSAFD